VLTIERAGRVLLVSAEEPAEEILADHGDGLTMRV